MGSIDYRSHNRTYSLDPNELHQAHARFCGLSDERFLEEVSGALHLAMFLTWMAPQDPRTALADGGLLHELVHLLDIPTCPLIQSRLAEVREAFAKLWLPPRAPMVRALTGLARAGPHGPELLQGFDDPEDVVLP